MALHSVLPEWRQFDFWIGTWDVVDPEDGRRLGVNVIEPMLNGCALLENWTAAGGGTGKSLNFYDPQRRIWRQVCVDAFGNVLDYRQGELLEGAMRFRGITLDPAGDTTFQKLSFHHVATDTIRQVFESSKDGGETWTEDWVGVYIRRSAESGGESTVCGSGVNAECNQMSAEQAIASVRQAYMDAFNNGDAKAVAALHTESSVHAPRYGGPAVSRREVRNAL